MYLHLAEVWEETRVKKPLDLFQNSPTSHSGGLSSHHPKSHSMFNQWNILLSDD